MVLWLADRGARMDHCYFTFQELEGGGDISATVAPEPVPGVLP